MAKVFISYRREDSAASAGRIQDRLEREFGRDLLFIDVDGIPLGVNFVNVLREEVAQCGMLLAVVGSNWLDVRDEDGTRRLDNPTDFVRIEIAAALQREIPVIPILLDGTRVPKADQLPEELKELAFRNGVSVRHASFHADLDKLIRALKRQVAPKIFISYRRGDTESVANHLKPELEKHLGKGKVFLDAKDTMRSNCFLALIGPKWLNIEDSQTKTRRLDNPDDVVRQEIRSALKNQNMTVVPVLVGDARMPDQEDLPDELKKLASRQAFELRQRRWEDDVRALAEGLRLIRSR